MVDKIKKYLFNDRGSSILIWLVIITLLFVIIVSFLVDVHNIYMFNKKVKNCINLAVKSACLEIKEDINLASGKFIIDEKKAYNSFINVIRENLNLDKNLNANDNSILFEKPIIKEFEVINDFSNKFHSITLDKDYIVKNPSVFVVIEFKIKLIFIKKSIIVNKLSSSQLTVDIK